MIILAYTDGGCTGNGGAHAKAACGVYIPQLNISLAIKCEGKQSNNCAELQAIYIALQNVPVEHDLIIVSDSSYSINIFTKWLPNWIKKNDLKKENIELILSIWRLICSRSGKTGFRHVNSHLSVAQKSRLSDIDQQLVAGNEVADSLASSLL